MTPSALTHSARTAAHAACRAADAAGRAQWAALRIPAARCDALEVFAAAAAGERFYWERPETGRAVAALGAVHAIESAGAGRFAETAQAARELLAAVHRGGAPAPARAGALLVGGFAFADTPGDDPGWRRFPPGRLVLPEALYDVDRDAAHCTVIRRVDPGAEVESEADALLSLAAGHRDPRRCALPAAVDPHFAAAASSWSARADRPRADYLALIEAALRGVAVGELEKVVLARAVELQRNDPIDTGDLLHSLRANFRGCTRFAVGRGEDVFLGASPEQLVQLAAGRVETAAVAGTAPRGRDPDEDLRLGRELCESKKEQAEHAVVVRALRDALAGLCRDVDIPEAPQLMRLDHLQHLATPITATLRNGATILDLVERLHPTPAVGGAPREAALDWIARREGLDRGWYAGPVGFVDAEGGGEFCVALRCALVRAGTARLFAGAGVVAGSRPEAELRETRLKLQALLAPLLEI